MSRYRVRMVPQGAIPRDLEVGIRLTPEGGPAVAPAACVSRCGGWGVTINGGAQSGWLFTIADAAFEIIVEHLGTLCPGDCINWEIRPILQDGNHPLAYGTIDIVTGAALCDQVTITGDASEGTYLGVIFGLWASINGQPFCETIVFTFTSFCVPTLLVNGWYSLLDAIEPSPETPVEPATPGAVLDATTFPNRAFTMDFSPDVYADWFVDQCGYLPTASFFAITGGNPLAYGDFSIVSTVTSNAVFRLVATGVNDYTGIQITLQPELLSYPVPPANVLPQIILDCTGVP